MPCCAVLWAGYRARCKVLDRTASTGWGKTSGMRALPPRLLPQLPPPPLLQLLHTFPPFSPVPHLVFVPVFVLAVLLVLILKCDGQQLMHQTHQLVKLRVCVRVNTVGVGGLWAGLWVGWVGGMVEAVGCASTRRNWKPHIHLKCTSLTPV